MADTIIQGQEPNIESLQASTPLTPGVPSPTAPVAGDPEERQPKVYDEAYVKQLRSEAAGYRTRLKEFESAEQARKSEEEARKLAELSEVDRLKAQLAETEKRAKALEVAGIRNRAAAKYGLQEDLLEFITAEDEAGALAQAEKLTSTIKPKTDLPASGGRNPANGGEQGAKLDETKRLEDLSRRVPAINNRVLKG